MALPANLTTNEVKNAAGTEEEFIFQENLPRGRIYAKSGAAPNYPKTLKISHQESGSGSKTIRRSVIRLEKEDAGADALATKVKYVAQLTVEVPIGNISDVSDITEVIANLLSFCASTGASTTILYDGTGYGAASLINGTL